MNPKKESLITSKILDTERKSYRWWRTIDVHEIKRNKTKGKRGERCIKKGRKEKQWRGLEDFGCQKEKRNGRSVERGEVSKLGGEERQLRAILIRASSLPFPQLEADLINAHYARSRRNDTVLFEFSSGLLSRRRLWKRYPCSGLPITTWKLIPPLPYRVLINDTRCSRSRGGSFPLVIIRILSASRLARGRRRRSLNGEIETITALDRS